MGTNKYFNFFHQRQEQDLVQTLISESIRIYGIDLIYIPRKRDDEDISIYGTDLLAYFDDYYDIEMYVKNIDSFEGEGDIFRKFGLDIKNQITFSVSRTTFKKVVNKELTRPREGDLIYLPMSTTKALYEIRFVKEDSVFYNIGEFYIYDLQCEQLALQDENIKTGLREIDHLGDMASQSMALRLASGSGEYEIGETIYQGPSLIGADAKGTVIEFDNPPNTIIIKDVFGEFKEEYGNIVGNRSGAEYELLQDQDTLDIQQDYSAENLPIETEGRKVIDFAEGNPFSDEDEF